MRFALRSGHQTKPLMTGQVCHLEHPIYMLLSGPTQHACDLLLAAMVALGPRGEPLCPSAHAYVHVCHIKPDGEHPAW